MTVLSLPHADADGSFDESHFVLSLDRKAVCGLILAQHTLGEGPSSLERLKDSPSTELAYWGSGDFQPYEFRRQDDTLIHVQFLTRYHVLGHVYELTNRLAALARLIECTPAERRNLELSTGSRRSAEALNLIARQYGGTHVIDNDRDP